MPKMTRGRKVIYQRTPNGAIFCRDGKGKVTIHRRRNDSGIYKVRVRRKKPKLHGRVDFTNRVRFAGRVRSQQTLASHWRHADGGLRIGDPQWHPLPTGPRTARREDYQGMAGVMAGWTITDDPVKNTVKPVKSANNYLTFLADKGVVPRSSQRWEWCHLIAHSLGGGGGPANVVAAPAANNSEQMALEHTLSKYGNERHMRFEFKVDAIVCGFGLNKYLGDVIRYQVRSRNHPNEIYTYYLDCKTRVVKISQIRFDSVQRDLADWMNSLLEQAYPVPLSAVDRAAITRD